jgi:histidyl-tRNA synthetase
VTAQELRRNKIPCDHDLLGRSLKAQMREADRQGARYVLVVGENEVRLGRGTLKSMSTGEQTSIELSKLVEEAKGRLRT